jgi:putative transposase
MSCGSSACRSAGPARCWGGTGRRGGGRRGRRRAPRAAEDEAAPTADVAELAKRHGRHGRRRIAALLRDAGWAVSRKRVGRVWRREGLKVPRRRPRRSRPWLNDGSCVRLRPERPGHVRAHDFVEGRTRDGRRLRMLCVVDELTREALAIRVARKLSSTDVIDALADLSIARGAPSHVRSDQGRDRSSWPRR